MKTKITIIVLSCMLFVAAHFIIYKQLYFNAINGSWITTASENLADTWNEEMLNCSCDQDVYALLAGDK